MNRSILMLAMILVCALAVSVAVRGQDDQPPAAPPVEAEPPGDDAAPSPPIDRDPVPDATRQIRVAPAEVEGDEPRFPRVTVTLIGGASMSGTLLKEGRDGVVLDLGYDVTRIPRDQVLGITTEEGTALERTAAVEDIFTLGRLKPAPVPELVQRVGDAVVMIRTPAGVGSGFIISDRGHVVTNYHVVERETRVRVSLFRPTPTGYRKHDIERVEILALHPLRDIALLQLDLSELNGWKPKPVVLAEDPTVEVGDMVFAVGNPLGLERSVTMGIVSSTTRTMGHLRMIQTDASVNPGNSGGPMFNARGEVVGIVCAGAMMFDGLGFGIPGEELVNFLRHRDAYLYDPAQPQNGVTYLDPPFRQPEAPDVDSPGNE